MKIQDPMHARFFMIPHVEYSLYFNPVLMAVNQDGKLEEIKVTNVNPGSINRFRAKEAGNMIEATIDGIIAELMTDYQQKMVYSIARPVKFVSGQMQISGELTRLTEEILHEKDLSRVNQTT
jgi:hypothetical protein